MLEDISKFLKELKELEAPKNHAYSVGCYHEDGFTHIVARSIDYLPATRIARGNCIGNEVQGASRKKIGFVFDHKLYLHYQRGL